MITANELITREYGEKESFTKDEVLSLIKKHREENKKKRRFVLAYDMALAPKGMTMKEVIKKASEEGVVIYNTAAQHNFGGRNSDSKPYVQDLGDGDYEDESNPNYKFIDESKKDN